MLLTRDFSWRVLRDAPHTMLVQTTMLASGSSRRGTISRLSLVDEIVQHDSI